MFINLLQKLLEPAFGSFEKEEFKKFLRMGLAFTFIIGSYWILGTLKNAIFCTMVNVSQIPWAKTVSLIFLIPIIMFYSKLLDKYKRDRVFYILSTIFIIVNFLYAILIYFYQYDAICNLTHQRSFIENIIAYSFFLFVDSYGSLMPVMFWGIASDTTTPESAKKGFSLIVALGQLGGILAPYFVLSLPRRLGFQTNSLSIIICSIMIFVSIILIKNFFDKTPKKLLESYQEVDQKDIEKKQEAGFFQGLKLLLQHNYLIGILGVVAFPEIIITIIELHFYSLASETYSGIALAEYLGSYGSIVNIFTFIFLIFGIGNITRFLGITISLVLMPFIYALSILGFISLNSLHFLFILMVASKSINYALNVPAIKQLYIPTTYDVRFKTQAWINSFGSSGAKQLGTFFNMLIGPLESKFGAVAGRAKHALFASYFSFFIIIAWVFMSLFLGRLYKKAIYEKKVIC